MDNLNHWHLSDDYTLVDAAMLILGIDPQELKKLKYYGFGGLLGKKSVETFNLIWDEKFSIEEQTPNSSLNPKEWIPQFEATVKSLVYAVDYEKLNAKIHRAVEMQWDEVTELHFEVTTKEVDIYKTTVNKADLEAWLKNRGVTGGFFFAESLLPLNI